MRAFYNEWEAFPAAWLENLAAAGKITPGTVSTKSICDLEPAELAGYERVHLFAGIGGWELALQLAGWPADLPVWTGSCPCQPFSSAGKRKGTTDERHLWPEMLRLIRECRPPVIFGEQVASKLGRAWLASVRADLEALGYAVGAADLCAAGVGAPHIRQRLWWGAVRLDHTAGARFNGTVGEPEGEARNETRLRVPGAGCAEGGLAHRLGAGLEGRAGLGGDDGAEHAPAERGGGAGAGGLGDAAGSGFQNGLRSADGESRPLAESERSGLSHAASNPTNPWANPEWLPCADGKARPTQPGLFPLASRLPGRVGQLRAYGNAIVPQVAAQFVTAFMKAVEGQERPQ